MPPADDLSPPPQPGTTLHSHLLPKQTPIPSGCHRGVCAMAMQGLGEAKQLFWPAQPPRGGKRRSRSLQPSPRVRRGGRPLPGSALWDEAEPGGRRWPERASATERSRLPHLAQPAVPTLLCLLAHCGNLLPSFFWVLGGYFPSGPTSLPVKESEVGRDLLFTLHLPLPPVTSGSTPSPAPTPRGWWAGAASPPLHTRCTC